MCKISDLYLLQVLFETEEEEEEEKKAEELEKWTFCHISHISCAILTKF